MKKNFIGYECFSDKNLHEFVIVGLVMYVDVPPQYMDYRNGYHKDHPVIKMFWTVFNDLPVEAKRKFLGMYGTFYNYAAT